MPLGRLSKQDIRACIRMRQHFGSILKYLEDPLKQCSSFVRFLARLCKINLIIKLFVYKPGEFLIYAPDYCPIAKRAELHRSCCLGKQRD